MKKVAELISYLSLGLLVGGPALFYLEKISLEQSKLLMLVATIVWFVTAIFWMGRSGEDPA
jgi:hypothetical protein